MKLHFATTLLLAATTEALVFKAVSHCSNSIPPYRNPKRDDVSSPQEGVLSIAKRQTTCSTPFLVAYADDGKQLTFNGGNTHWPLEQGQQTCHSTNGNYNGEPIGVDRLEGSFDGGYLNFRSCPFAYGVSYKDCAARINGNENTHSTKTNCNDCKGGFFQSCTCCAVTF
jgi:hypothetical protein